MDRSKLVTALNDAGRAAKASRVEGGELAPLTALAGQGLVTRPPADGDLTTHRLHREAQQKFLEAVLAIAEDKPAGDVAAAIEAACDAQARFESSYDTDLRALAGPR